MNLVAELKHARRHSDGASFASRKPHHAHCLRCNVFRVLVGESIR